MVTTGVFMSFIQRLGLEEENIVVTDTLADLSEANVDSDTRDEVMTDNSDNLDMTSQALSGSWRSAM
jgi:hypothetical protein